MSVWGKIIGGTAGFALGGPLGAILGVMAGNFYDKSWNFSKGKAFETILDKIYYLRYNKPGDNFYFRIGGMPNATLGYGIIVDNYSNMVEYPNIRRLGMDMQLNFGKDIKTQILVSDFKRVSLG